MERDFINKVISNSKRSNTLSTTCEQILLMFELLMIMKTNLFNYLNEVISSLY